MLVKRSRAFIDRIDNNGIRGDLCGRLQRSAQGVYNKKFAISSSLKTAINCQSAEKGSRHKRVFGKSPCCFIRQVSEQDAGR